MKEFRLLDVYTLRNFNECLSKMSQEGWEPHSPHQYRLSPGGMEYYSVMLVRERR